MSATAPNPQKILEDLVTSIHYGGIKESQIKSTIHSLCAQNVDFNQLVSSIGSLLHELVLKNDKNQYDEEIKALVQKHKANPNIKDSLGNTPLANLLTSYSFFVAKINHLKHSGMLLAELGADATTICSNTGNSLLHVLVGTNKEKCNSVEIATLLKLYLKDPNIPNNEKQTAMDYLLIKYSWRKLSLNDLKETGLILVAHSANAAELVHELVIRNKGGCNNEALKHLFGEYKIPVDILNKEGLTPLHHAIETIHDNNYDFKFLLNFGANYQIKDDQGTPIVHIAWRRGLFAFVLFLIEEKGVDVNIKDNDKATLLHIITFFCEETSEFYDKLIAKGIDVNALDTLQYSALDNALMSQQKDYAKWLLEQGAITTLVDPLNATHIQITTNIMNKISENKLAHKEQIAPEPRIEPTKSPVVETVISQPIPIQLPFELEFYDHLKEIQAKITEFEPKISDDNYLKAYNAAKSLHTKLKEAGDVYFASDESKPRFELFQLICKTAITEARSVLERNRGWTRILVNLLCMLALPIYLTAAAVNYSINGKFTFFATDTETKLDALEDCIQESTHASH